MNCPKCGKEMKLIPGGISKKSGKPYNAFYSCDPRAGGCSNTVNTTAQGSPSQRTSVAEAVGQANERSEVVKLIKDLHAKVDALMVFSGMVPAKLPLGNTTNPTEDSPF